MKNDLISIIIPLHNGNKNYFLDCINSIINQTYKNLEIIIVDDGSKKYMADYSDYIATLDKRIKIFHKKNGGVSSARNFGIKKSAGKYFCFIDSDDLCEKTMVELLYNNIIKCGADISICGYTYIEFDGNRYQKFGTGTKKILSQLETLILFFDDNIGVAVWNKMFKKSIVSKISFNEKLNTNEDRLYLFDSIMKSNKIVFEDKCLYNYIKRKNSATTSAFSVNRFDVLEVNKIISNTINNEFYKNDYVIFSEKKNEVIYLIRLIREFKLTKSEKKFQNEYEYIKLRLSILCTKDILNGLNRFEKLECVIFNKFEFLYYPLFSILTKISFFKKVKTKFQSKEIKK